MKNIQKFEKVTEKLAKACKRAKDGMQNRPKIEKLKTKYKINAIEKTKT